MDYVRYAKTGEDISALGLGLMRLPLVNEREDEIDYPAAKAMLDACYRAGVNYFDTAYGYHGGKSQNFAARALAEYPRESYKLATKLPMWLVETRQDAERLFNEQLESCKVDYFDFYLFHAVNAASAEKIAALNLWSMFDEKRRQGKIRNLGFSFHDKPSVLEKMCANYQWDFVQIQLNYLDYRNADFRDQYPILHSRGIPIILMEPVRGGRLADLGQKANEMLKAEAPQKSVASWALRWAGSLPGVLTVLSGMSTLEQVEDNLATFGPLQPLSQAEKAALEQALDVFTQSALIPCTQCRYCMPCPAGLDIPGLFTLYNSCAFDSWPGSLQGKYAKLQGKNAGDCVACGHCEPLCPQQIPIIKQMRQLHNKAAKS